MYTLKIGNFKNIENLQHPSLKFEQGHSLSLEVVQQQLVMD